MSGLGGGDLTAVLLSLKVATVATLADLPFALAVAYVLARRRFIGRALLDAVVHLPLILPPVATGFALLILLGHRGLIGGPLERLGLVFAFRWTGAAVAAGVMAFPLIVRPIRQAIEAIEPEVLEAALTLGAGPAARVFRVVLPLAAPGIMAALVLGFAKSLGEFGATITFVAAIPGETRTLPTAIYEATQNPGGEGQAVTLCLVAAAIALGAIIASEALNRRSLSRRSPAPESQATGTAG